MSTEPNRPDGVLDLTPSGMSAAYQALLDRAVEQFSNDPRATALFVVGSAGRGAADPSSDLDLLLAATDQAAAEELVAEWEAMLERLTPTIYRRLLHGMVITAVTPTWERLDLTIVAAEVTPFMPGPATTVFDRGDTAPPPAAEPAAVDPDALTARTEDLVRSLGLMVTDLDRGEPTTLAWASEFLIQELVDLLFLDAGLARRTVKRIHVDLPDEHRAILDRLTELDGRGRDGLIAKQVAIAEAFLSRARPLLEAAGGVWPTELCEATARYLDEKLSVELDLP